MRPAKKDSENPYFKSKYADLASVWDACREALSANEIAVIQAPDIRDGVFGIRTKLIHSSGEYEEGFMPVAAPITAKAQEMGSAITYARRYSLSAMVGVAQDDDDGNAAQNSGVPRPKRQPKHAGAFSSGHTPETAARAAGEQLKAVAYDEASHGTDALRAFWEALIIEDKRAIAAAFEKDVAGCLALLKERAALADEDIHQEEQAT